MKILLASDGKAAVLGMKHLVPSLKGLRILCIVTASMKRILFQHIEFDLRYLIEKGAIVSLFDISGKTQEELRSLVQNFDLILFEGGDPFYLLDQIKKTGFDQLLKEWIKDKPYVGVSAGSYIMQPSIEIPTWYHPKEEWDYLSDFSGINAVNFFFLVHSQKKNKEEIIKRAESEGKSLKIVNDGEAILVKDNTVEVIKIYD